MNWLCFLIQPSSQLTPPTDSVTCDNHHASSVLPNPGSHAQKGNNFFFNFLNNWKKKGCRFPLYHIWAEALWYVRLYVSKQRWAGFCYLTALQHPVDEPLCRMPLQGMVFVRAWAKATTSNPLLSLLFSSSESELCIQYKLATSLTWSETKSKAYWGAQLRKYKYVDISTCGLLQVVFSQCVFWIWISSDRSHNVWKMEKTKKGNNIPVLKIALSATNQQLANTATADFDQRVGQRLWG